MPVGTRVCIELCDSLEIAGEHVMSLLHELQVRNVVLYHRGVVTTPPWALKYAPDSRSRTVAMRDACVLATSGQGSCGELAAAYAAALVHEGDSGARVVVIPQGTNAWHAVAVGGDGEVYDPQDANGPQ
jgi:hypothetical protein